MTCLFLASFIPRNDTYVNGFDLNYGIPDTKNTNEFHLLRSALHKYVQNSGDEFQKYFCLKFLVFVLSLYSFIESGFSIVAILSLVISHLNHILSETIK